jgi:hypothetical protein
MSVDEAVQAKRHETEAFSARTVRRSSRAIIRSVQREPIYERANDAAVAWTDAQHWPSVTASTITPPIHVFLARKGLILVHAEVAALAILDDWRAALKELRASEPSE